LLELLLDHLMILDDLLCELLDLGILRFLFAGLAQLYLSLASTASRKNFSPSVA